MSKVRQPRRSLRPQHQCQYARNAWDLRKIEKGLPEVSTGVRRKVQNHADRTCASDHQLFGVT